MKKRVLMIVCVILAMVCGYAQLKQTVYDDSIYNKPDVLPKAENELSLIDFLGDKLCGLRNLGGVKTGTAFVVVKMVVEKDGTPTHFEVLGDSTAPQLDYQALFTAKKLPKFTPAQKNGKIVRSTYCAAVPYRIK